MYFINSGNVGIGYSIITNLSAKLHINGNLKCDDIIADQIGLGTSTNHTNTLLDVRGNCSFGDSTSLVQAIALKSQSGVWHIQSDNWGNNNNNQFVISSLRTISGHHNVITKFLLIDNITTYVGIGKTPSYKLDVDGDVNIKSGSKYKINGNNLSYADLDNNLFTSLDTTTLSVDSSGELSVIGGGGSSQWTTNGTSIYPSSSSTNVVIGSTQTSSYKLQVNGSVNTTSSYNINNSDIRYYTPFYNNQIVQTIFSPFKRMAIKSNTETDWTLVDASSTGFIVSITPTSIYSGILLDLKMHFGLHWSTDARWWGARLYRRYGVSGTWLHVTGAGGNETSNDSSATNNGTECWFADTAGVNANATIGTCSASYMDFPQTTSVVYYTIAVKCRLGETTSNGNGNDTFYINRAHEQSDAFRPSPMSSWTAQEVWRTSTSIRNVINGI